MKSILDGVKYNKLSEYKNNKEIKMFIYYDNIYNKKSICLKWLKKIKIKPSNKI